MQQFAPARPDGKAVFAAIAGNALEFYDFVTYAFFAVFIGKAFFPTHDSFTSLLLSVGTFGIGFFTRPLGSVLIGAYADYAGRRPAMLLTIALMALGTLLLVLTPPFAMIGFAAPVLVVLGRLIQGFGLGGEVGPATAYLFEIAPPAKRGLYASWQPASQGVAIFIAGILGLLLSATLPPDAMASWGWRIPFLLGLAIIPFAAYMRRHLPETVGSERAKRAAAPAERKGAFTPLLQLLAKYRVILFAVMAQILFGTIGNYIGNYMTTYAVTTLHLPATVAISATLMVGFCTFAGALLGGWLADVYGRRITMLVPRIILLLIAYPAFELVIRQPSAVNLFVVTAIVSGLSMISGGASFAAISDAFPGPYRGTGLSVSYAFIVTVFGGTTQLVVAWLIGVTGDAAVPAYYLLVATAISMVALYWLPDAGRLAPGIAAAEAHHG